MKMKIRWGFLLIIMIALAGCVPKVKQQTTLMEDRKVNMSTRELRLRVDTQAFRFAQVMESAADRIIDETRDPQVHANALRMKVFIVGQVQQILGVQDPLAVAFDLWAFCFQMEAFLHGPGTYFLGEQKAVALEAIAFLETHIYDGVKDIPTASEVTAENARGNVKTWADAHPIDRKSFGRPSPIMDLASMLGMDNQSAMDTMASLDESARQISGHLSLMNEYIAKHVRWQVELMVLNFRQDFRNDPQGKKLMGMFERLTQEVEGAPDLVQSIWGRALEDIHRERATTLTEIRKTTEEISLQLNRQMEQQIDHFAWRAAQLIFLFLVLAFFGSLWIVRMARRRA